MASPHFNPKDWSTITPLFQALIDAPVAPGDFPDWLAEWNRLDIAVWDAYTTLKRKAYYDTTDHAAEAAYGRYVQELFSTYLGLTDGLITRALTQQPEPPSSDYAQLWRRWHNQKDLFHPDNLPIQAEISRLEVYYREIMNGVDAENPARYWLDRRAELNDLTLRLLDLRRTLARNSGLPSFLHFRWRELNRIDTSIADCQQFHQSIERIVVPEILRQRANYAPNYAMPEVGDAQLLKDGSERMLRRVDPQFGEIFSALRDDYLDFGSRPGKAHTVEEWFFPGAGLPYLHVVTTNPASVLHESGHGMHDYLSFRAHGSMWNLNGPEEFQEFAATCMELLGASYYETERGGFYTPAESEQARQYGLWLNFDWLAECALEDSFEHWLYGAAADDVTPADLDAKWLELNRRFKPWMELDANDAAAQTGWQRNKWSLFRMPLYMITYPIAFVGACQFVQTAEQDRRAAIAKYKHALATGNTRPLPELFRTVGINFPFAEAAVAETVRFVLEQSNGLLDNS